MICSGAGWTAATTTLILGRRAAANPIWPSYRSPMSALVYRTAYSFCTVRQDAIAMGSVLTQGGFLTEVCVSLASAVRESPAELAPCY